MPRPRGRAVDPVCPGPVAIPATNPLGGLNLPGYRAGAQEGPSPFSGSNHLKDEAAAHRTGMATGCSVTPVYSRMSVTVSSL